METKTERVFGSKWWCCFGNSIVFIDLNKIHVEVTVRLPPCMRWNTHRKTTYFSKLLWRFDSLPVASTKPWKSNNLSLILQEKLLMRITKREDAAPQESNDSQS